MKLALFTLLALVVGAVIGIGAARVHCMQQIHAHFASSVQALAEKQEYTCAISLAALDRLEAGETERAKFLLAREVASYYRYPFGQTQAQRQKLLDHIEKSSATSQVLKDEIGKKAK